MFVNLIISYLKYKSAFKDQFVPRETTLVSLATKQKYENNEY
ncbi:hypothetical protein RCH18_000941 [Flavobacterium sp. PL11]|nr:hypothetical protein [Flavobacterium sp. PL11]